MKFADLHLHTVYSDGTYTPAQLIAASKKAKMSAIAIVDHDTVEAIQPSLAIAQKEEIELVPGIELTAELDGSEVHILGYFIDYRSGRLLEQLEILKSNRIQRVHKMTQKLKELNIEISPEEIFALAQEGTVGRLHVARAMVLKGAVSCIAEAFKKYLGDKGPAYVCGFRFTPKEAIALIKGEGGIPVLAHPYSLFNDDLIPAFVDDGIMGLEVYYPEHSQSTINYYLGLAKKYNLLVTGGSDCHGDAKPDVPVGLSKVPYELVEELKNAKERLS